MISGHLPFSKLDEIWKNLPQMKQNWTAKDIPDLSDKTIIVTGANSGIGYQAALEFARKNAFVWLACRNDEKANAALKKIKEQVPTAKVKYAHLDLADLSTVKPFVASVKKESKHIDILVNNAGVFPDGPRKETKDGFELGIGANHLGHFALTAELLPLLKKSDSPRIVNVSSDAHKSANLNLEDIDLKKSYSSFASYTNSKLANLLFSLELQKRADDAGWKLVVASAHPGFSSTGINAIGGEQTWLAWIVGYLAYFFAQSDVQGAWPTEYAATSEDAVPNAYYGPNGWFEIKGNPKLVFPSKAAQNEEVAKKLWELSEAKTNVKYQCK